MTEASKADSLFRAYRRHFAIGAAVNLWQLQDPSYSALILRHFNSITAENDMKPERLLDHQKTLELGDEIRTVQNYTYLDQYLSYAREHGIQVRFHVLCWHNQTPAWFFTKGWQDVSPDTMKNHWEEVPFASADVMLARQEAYIRDVMTYVNTNYPGVVSCWDVVNEAIEPDQGNPDCYRVNSPWYHTAGAEFIPAAFRAARKYQAPGQLLCYNDYNCFQDEKLAAILRLLKKLQAENLVDCMGMQAHMTMEFPEISACEKAARAYAGLGLALQTTELDIHCTDNLEEGQIALAEKYAGYYDMLVRLKNEGHPVSSVTCWGVTDRDSWLPGFRKSPSYPLLFTADKETKPAFDAVAAVPGRYDGVSAT